MSIFIWDTFLKAQNKGILIITTVWFQFLLNNKNTCFCAKYYFLCSCIFLLCKFKAIRNHKTMIQITKKITGKSIKNHKKAAKIQYYIYMYKGTKYSKIRLQYKLPFLKVKGQFNSSFSNRMFNFPCATDHLISSTRYFQEQPMFWFFL